MLLRRRRDGKVFCPSCDPKSHRGKRCPAWEEHDGIKHWRNLRQHMNQYHPPEQVIPVVSPHPDVLPTEISIKHHGHPDATDAAAKVPGVLEAEITYFNDHRAEWLEKHKGQWALVKTRPAEEDCIFVHYGFHDTFEEAVRDGCARFGNAPMLIRQVFETDPVVNLPTVWHVPSGLDPEEVKRLALLGGADVKDVEFKNVSLDATGIQPGESRAGKVSFPVRPVKPGSPS
jgi:hypothetical protein